MMGVASSLIPHRMLLRNIIPVMIISGESEFYLKPVVLLVIIE